MKLSLLRELNMLKEVEHFYFTEEWAFDAILLVPCKIN